MWQNTALIRLKPLWRLLIPILLVGALVSDLLAPLGPVALWLSAGAAVVLLLLLLLSWLDQRRLAGLLAGEFRLRTVLLLAAGAMIGFFLLGAIARIGPGHGYLAAVVPAVADWQERTLGAAAAVGNHPERETEPVADEAAPQSTPLAFWQDQLARLQATPVPVADPQTPPEWLHNARLAAAQGEFAQAQAAYGAAIQLNPDLVDPVIEAVELVRQRAGTAAARTWLATQQNGESASPALALADTLLIESPTERVVALQTLAAQLPEFGPLFYHLVLEYDALLRRQFTQSQAQAQRTAYAVLQTEAATGNLQKYYLDQALAQQALATAQQRVERTTRQAENLKLEFIPYFAASGVTIDVVLPDPQVQELRYAIDQSPLRSTGVVSGGHQRVNTSIGPLPLTKRDHTLSIQYTDAAGVESPRYTFDFTVEDLVINVTQGVLDQETGDFPVQFTMTVVDGQADELYTFRYSVDAPTLDQEHLGLGAGTVVQIAPVTVGEHTLYVQATLTETSTSVVTHPFTVR